MAHASSDLYPIQYAGNGVSIWGCDTADDKTTVDTADYFNDSAGILQAGSVILVRCAISSGVPGAICWRKVSTNDGTTVDIAALDA